jgi:hypothetical protein
MRFTQEFHRRQSKDLVTTFSRDLDCYHSPKPITKYRDCIEDSIATLLPPDQAATMLRWNLQYNL